MTLNISNKDNNILFQAQSEDFSAKTIESVGYGLEINELNQPYASDNLFAPEFYNPNL